MARKSTGTALWSLHRSLFLLSESTEERERKRRKTFEVYDVELLREVRGCGDIGDMLSLKSYGRFW